MPAKRKRNILFDFDPNKSDSEDENFEPGEDRGDRPRRSKKKQRPVKALKSGSRRRNDYEGSDIDEDGDEVSDDSLQESYAEDDEDDEDDEPVTSATGRRTRKAAIKHQSYKESSEDSNEEPTASDGDSDASEDVKPKPKKAESVGPQTPRKSRIITLKMNSKSLRDRAAAATTTTTRRTRATTEEADELIELSTSGRHARPARTLASVSPERRTAVGRQRRASKGTKKPPVPAIEEATQESSEPGLGGDEGEAEMFAGGDGADESTLRDPVSLHSRLQSLDATSGAGRITISDLTESKIEVGDSAEGDDDNTVEKEANEDIPEDVAMEDEAAGEEDDEDDMPVGRRTRQTRSTAAAAPVDEVGAPAEEKQPAGDADVDADADADADVDADADASNTVGRRLTRGSRLRKAKSLKEPSSDFEPVDDEESGDGAAFDSDASKHHSGHNGDDDSSQNSRGRRRSTRIKSGTKRTRGAVSDDEDDVDRDEVAMEAEELRASSHSRPRRRRRSPSIVYEATSRRRTTKVVDYSIKPLDQYPIEQEEDDEPTQTPARRRNGRGGGAASLWQRNLLSTFGPFGGGGGDGSLIGGPWGTGAAGGVDSDSSDDEMITRTGLSGAIGGNVGMTPTTGTAPSGFAAPLNLESITGVSANTNVGKVKNHKALADADPLGVDMNVDFSKVGGLQGHINQLKEMVTLPLLYPELFLRFKVTPPRGVLFHGPPGTGKTLLARALANSVGVGGRKITFYMRKGADALSKWVGEAEKQLRLLFEEARRTQPSIIFFDEIDGLAPVRSSKQEQIHASIVSTLLALMDGMDGRGQVIVIGATNRPDNIDPALRRPGRFDREFYFPLPDLEGRRSIIEIHTKDWDLSDDFKGMLAENSKGYGGADLRALCTEAALNAIQRTYPQIYSAPDKLIVNPERIFIHATDFTLSMSRMIPSSERSATPAWAPLPKPVAPLLSDQLLTIQTLLDDVMPRRKKTTALEEAMFEPLQDADHGFGRENMIQAFERSRTFRPRLVLTGMAGMGQGYLAAAILHNFEGVHIQSFDLPVLLGDGRPLEQVIVGLFVEVKRHKPAVIYIPNIDVWHNSITESAYVTFTTMLKSIPPNDPVLVLATCECEEADIPRSVLRDLFGYSSKNRFALEKPTRESRRNYFISFVEHASRNPSEFPDPANRKKRVLEELPIAPPPPPKVKTKEEIREELRRDHLLLNLLKVQLQPIMDQIKKYKKFRQPVIPETQISYLWQEADPSYVQPDIASEQPRPFVITRNKEGAVGLWERETNKFYYNLDLSTIEERLSNGFYARPKDFYEDVVSLAKDARNIGDKERLLKANELVTNVEVDVAEAEARLSQVNWEELYQRQLKRARDAEAKAAKRKAGLAIVGAVGVGGGTDEAAIRPIGSDIVPAVPGEDELGQQVQAQQQARFQLKPDIGFGSSPSTSNGYSHHGSNGTSVPSGRLTNGDEDVSMTGADLEDSPRQNAPSTPLGLHWARSTGPSAMLDASTRATAGNTQVSQMSVLTGMPAGMSPSAMLNEASTTKSSGPWSTQATNGTHGTGSGSSGGHGPVGVVVGVDAAEGSQIPDTQSVFGSLPSQAPSSNEWVHSQWHEVSKAEFEGSNGKGLSGNGPSPSASQQSAVQPLGPPPVPSQNTGPRQNSGSRLSSQAFPISAPDAHLDSILDTILDRTSGCTVDQLEQISREIMDYIWTTRHERNRSRVISNLSKVFNRTIVDMEAIQGLNSSFSQEQ